MNITLRFSRNGLSDHGARAPRAISSGWPGAAGVTPAVVLAALWALAPGAGAQATGPITPDPSRASQDQAPTQASTPQASAKTSIAGAWNLNKDQSDDPREKMREAMGNNGGGQGGGQRRGGGWGGGQGGQGGGWGGPGGGQSGGGWGGGQGGQAGGQGGMNRGGGGEGPRGEMDMADLSQLTIAQTDTTATVTGASAKVLALYSSSSSTADSSQAQTKDKSQGKNRSSAPPAAQWQGDQLVVVTDGPRGGKSTRTYSLSPDKTQLYVSTTLDNPRFSAPVSIRLVYDQGKPGTGAGG